MREFCEKQSTSYIELSYVRYERCDAMQCNTIHRTSMVINIKSCTKLVREEVLLGLLRAVVELRDFDTRELLLALALGPSV